MARSGENTQSPEYPIDDDEVIVTPDRSGEMNEDEIKEELFKKYNEGRLAEVEPETAVIPREEHLPEGRRYEEYPISGIGSDPLLDDAGRRLLPSQIQMRYLLDPNDVPIPVNKKLWGIVSRHLELINITSERELPYFQREIRNVIRTAMWDHDMKDVPFTDVEQVEFYARVLLMKSLHHGERLALMTTIQRSQVEEYGERSPSTAVNTGFFGSLRNFFGGRR
jgi:hypothetical protein